MAFPPKAAGHIPALPVDKDTIVTKLHKDNDVTRFAAQAAEFLKKTRRPNIITVAEFAPFIALFKMDYAKCNTNSMSYDQAYHHSMIDLQNKFRTSLDINMYEITIVIDDRISKKPVYYIDRGFSRIRSDFVEGNNFRDKVPSTVPRTSPTSREEEVLKASMHDLMSANSTEEAITDLGKQKIESAVVKRNFTEKNLSPEKRKEILEAINRDKVDVDTPEAGVFTSSGITVMLDDDDD